MSPLAHAGYGISAAEDGTRNSMWSTMAIVHSMLLQVFMRTLQAAGAVWDDVEQAAEFESLGQLRADLLKHFVEAEGM